MAKIEIYTTRLCPYCVQAKLLLSEKGAEFNEIQVDTDNKKRFEMTKRANGGYTVPQIFINDEHIGGFDDMYALDQKGLLDEKLNSA